MKNKEKETDIFLHHMPKWWEGEAAREYEKTHNVINSNMSNQNIYQWREEYFASYPYPYYVPYYQWREEYFASYPYPYYVPYYVPYEDMKDTSDPYTKYWFNDISIAPYRTKLDFIPVFLPTKLYYGEKNGKMTTVLEYSNGEKIKVTGNLKNNKKESHITLINGVIIALFKHEFKKIKINEIYDNQTESEALAQIRNMLLGHFISRQTFKSEKHFNKWLIDFVWDNI